MNIKGIINIKYILLCSIISNIMGIEDKNSTTLDNTNISNLSFRSDNSNTDWIEEYFPKRKSKYDSDIASVAYSSDTNISEMYPEYFYEYNEELNKILDKFVRAFFDEELYLNINSLKIKYDLFVKDIYEYVRKNINSYIQEAKNQDLKQEKVIIKQISQLWENLIQNNKEIINKIEKAISYIYRYNPEYSRNYPKNYQLYSINNILYYYFDEINENTKPINDNKLKKIQKQCNKILTNFKNNPVNTYRGDNEFINFMCEEENKFIDIIKELYDIHSTLLSLSELSDCDKLIIRNINYHYKDQLIFDTMKYFINCYKVLLQHLKIEEKIIYDKSKKFVLLNNFQNTLKSDDETINHFSILKKISKWYKEKEKSLDKIYAKNKEFISKYSFIEDIFTSNIR